MMLLRAPANAKNRSRQRIVKEQPVPFPVGGWDASSPLASMPVDRAVQLKNWFPQPGWGEIRRGYRKHAGSMGVSTPVETVMAWRGPSSSKLFAAAGSVIYDVSAATDAVPVVTGAASARNQHTNFTTAAGHFLYVVNGADAAAYYNGSAWVAPSITGVSSTDLVHVHSHKARLWFVEINSTSAWYLDAAAVSGTATEFPLGGLFSRGGSLMAMGTWTRDGGAGVDDFAVFVSSEGQCALYQGTDPSAADTWALVGVFDVPTPVGRRCFFKYGADLGLITVAGVFPLSQLLSVDESQSIRVALTQNISAAFATAYRSYGSNWGWEACVYRKGTRLIVNVPTVEGETAVQYVMNTLTGAWCEFDSHNAQSWVVWNDNLYFGGPDGAVYKADTGAVDYDSEIVAVGQTAYNALNSPYLKQWKMVRPLITASGGLRPEIGVSCDFTETDNLTGSGTANAAGAVFGTAVFGTSVFASDSAVSSEWVTTGNIGVFGSIKFRGRIGVSADDSAAKWGVAQWGVDVWGAGGSTEETLKINGFMVTAEVGGVL